MKNVQETIDRYPAVAGQFYPGKADTLQEELNQLFGKATPKECQNVRAIICPHAGYVFSGIVAASAFRQLDADKQYQRIILLGSSHQEQFDGASIYCDGDFVMSYGKEHVDTAFGHMLIKRFPELFSDNPRPHQREHSLEVQLPFLHNTIKTPYSIVPIVLGTSDRTICQQIAKALKPWFNEENLFIISSDFSHYPSYTDAQRIDSRTKDAILSNDPEKLLKTLWNNAEARIPRLATSLCGWTSVLTLLYMTNHEKALSYKAINYMNSGDSELYGEKDRVVGYWAIAVTEKIAGDIEEMTSETEDKTTPKATNETTDEEKHASNKIATAETSFTLTEADKAQLLSIARGSLEACVRGNSLPQIDTTNVSGVLKTNCGAFVTLHIHGNLRGCIGRLTGNLPLYKIVQEMAVAAALHDYRFMPVSPDELKQIDIELSVLSPLKKIDDVAEIELGKHGVLIEKNRRSGVFLPQVATETHWTLDEFLGHCARDKAGLEWDEWKTANLYIYTATVFGDS